MTVLIFPIHCYGELFALFDEYQKESVHRKFLETSI